jgi:hypothetical protein
MDGIFRCDFAGAANELAHFWQHSLGCHMQALCYADGIELGVAPPPPRRPSTVTAQFATRFCA